MWIKTKGIGIFGLLNYSAIHTIDINVRKEAFSILEVKKRRVFQSHWTGCQHSSTTTPTITCKIMKPFFTKFFLLLGQFYPIAITTARTMITTSARKKTTRMPFPQIWFALFPFHV